MMIYEFKKAEEFYEFLAGRLGQTLELRRSALTRDELGREPRGDETLLWIAGNVQAVKGDSETVKVYFFGVPEPVVFTGYKNGPLSRTKFIVRGVTELRG